MTTDAVKPGLTEELAGLAVNWRHPVPAQARDLAERAVVDTIAVSLAAANDPTVAALFNGLGAELRGGPSSVWVGGLHGDPRDTALVNGVCAHALDFDDVDDQMIGHPSAVLVPAVLAAGEETGASGAKALDAYWVGLAVSRELASALGMDSHYRAGWHSTGTVGAVAAAAASARILGLSVAQVRHALGIAGSLAAGSRQNFGTMTKPLHAGVAASNGILAAKLAGSGFTADTRQLERPLGYLALHDSAPGNRRADPDEVAQPSLNVKLHACCYYIHAAADAMLELVAAGLQPHCVERIVVTGPPEGFDALIHHRPRTGLQGKFSMEYAMAACLLDGALGLSTFTDASVTRPEAQRLLAKVELHTAEVPPLGPADWEWGYAALNVETAEGEPLSNRVDKPRGHASRPLAEHELRRKFDDCLAYGGLRPSDELYAALRGLREAESLCDVTRLVSVLAGQAGARRPEQVVPGEGAR
ncbi:MAG: MmgE/PrpD family protein [Actinophytocola sp.]|nr:MmgE/PrpD family protein [Actinophytocola sp.]